MNYRSATKQFVKHIATEYLPERTYHFLGKQFLVNSTDSAFGEFTHKSEVLFNPGQYARSAMQIFREHRDGFFSGVHPTLANIKPKASSWIPLIAGQTSAYILNFPAIQYSLNDPLVLVFRYVLYKNNEKFIDKSFTKALLPNTASCVSWPGDEAIKPEDGLVGRLIVYCYAPLFKANEFRFFVVNQSDGLIRCGVHSWGSSPLGLYQNRPRFEFRNKTPSLNGNEEYKFFQELFTPLPCLEKQPQNGSSQGKLQESQVLQLEDFSKLYTGGYFLGFNKDKKGQAHRIWHDNDGFMDSYQFPNDDKISDLTIETDFYVPANDYYAQVVMAHPIGVGIAIGDEFKVSAYHARESEPFFTDQVQVDYQIFGAKPTTFQLNLKDFFQKIRPMLQSKDEVVQISLSFKPKGSQFSIAAYYSIQGQIFLYSNSDIMCDQYHTGVSGTHMLNPSPAHSPRSNKFGPFYADRLNTSYLIINNRFPPYISMRPRSEGSDDIPHNIRISLYLDNEAEASIKYLTTSPKEKFYAIHVREFFNLEKDKSYKGMVHIFSATANFWGYFMTVGRNKDDFSVMCDHLSGG